MNPRAVHWLRKNAAERIPRRIVTLDCESHRTRSTKGEQHDFACGVASFDLLRADSSLDGDTVWLYTDNPCELWSCVDDFCSTSHRTVLFAHNASYDVRISSALRHLPSIGYRVNGIALNSYGFWAQFKNGAKSLWICDSLSFVPASLDKVAAAVRLDRAQLPEAGATVEELLARCRADVEITREAILRVVRFIKDEQLGDFRTTGPAQASAAFRHRFLREKSLLVHADDTALEAERRAAWAGRCEVWKHGDYESTCYEYDYSNAYARIAKECLIPCRYQTDHGGIPLHRLSNVMQSYAVCADVRVSVDMPLVPSSTGGSIVWPTGEFRTTLWDCELQLLLSTGARIEVERYWYYRRSPLLKDWATWIINQLALPQDKLDPVVRFMLKDWSRSLIGRFGLKYSTLDEIAQVPTDDVKLFGVYDGDTKITSEYLQLGQQLFERMGKIESPNSTPAVMSWVMAQSRVRLWNAMTAAGLANILYVDTDGLIVTKTGAVKLNRAIKYGELRGLRLKTKYQGGSFRAPRNIDLGEIRRVSGAPRKAERLAPSVYRGEVWESLPTALKRHNSSQVFLHEQTFHISDNDPRRVHLADGLTRPLRFPDELPQEVAISA